MIALGQQMCVFARLMNDIARVIAQHPQRLFRQIILDDVVQIFVVSPRQMHVVKTTMWFVNAIFGVELRIVRIRIGGEKFGVHDFIRKRATNRIRVAHDRPLRLIPFTEHFAEIVNEPGENKPARMPVLANRFGGLQGVNDLWQG